MRAGPTLEHGEHGLGAVPKRRRVRVPYRVVAFLDGTQAAADIRRAEHAGQPVGESDGDVAQMIRRLHDVPRLADDSRSLLCTDDELTLLWDYGSYLADCSGDDAGESMDALADVNSGRAMMCRVEKLRAKS